MQVHYQGKEYTIPDEVAFKVFGKSGPVSSVLIQNDAMWHILQALISVEGNTALSPRYRAMTITALEQAAVYEQRARVHNA